MSNTGADPRPSLSLGFKRSLCYSASQTGNRFRNGWFHGCAEDARVKKAASGAIVAAGATITHHHAVGIDHAPYMQAEIGTLGLEVLRSIKDTLDPTGIMNPGKLIPETDNDAPTKEKP